MAIEKGLRTLEKKGTKEVYSILLPDSTNVSLTPEERAVLNVLIVAWQNGEHHVDTDTLINSYIPRGKRFFTTENQFSSTVMSGIRQKLNATDFEVVNLTTPMMRLKGIKGGYAFRQKF